MARGGHKSEQGLWGRLGHTESPVPTARCCSEQAPLGTPLLQEPSQGHHSQMGTPRPPSPKPCGPTHTMPRPGTAQGHRGSLPEAVGGQEGRAPAGAATAAAPREAPALRNAAAGQPQGRHCRGEQGPHSPGEQGMGWGGHGEGPRLQCGTLQGPGDKVASSLLARRGGAREAVK